MSAATATAPVIGRIGLIAGLALLFGLLGQLVSAGLARELLIWPASGVAFAFGWRYGGRWTLPAGAGASPFTGK